MIDTSKNEMVNSSIEKSQFKGACRTASQNNRANSTPT